MVKWPSQNWSPQGCGLLEILRKCLLEPHCARGSKGGGAWSQNLPQVESGSNQLISSFISPAASVVVTAPLPPDMTQGTACIQSEFLTPFLPDPPEKLPPTERNELTTEGQIIQLVGYWDWKKKRQREEKRK